MYLRFVSPLKAEGSTRARDLHMGIFQAVMHCRDDIDTPAWLHCQLEKEFDWFKIYLPTPNEDVFRIRHCKTYHWDSLCWFKASARQMIKRAWALKALIEEAGLPITVLHTDNPGWIIYRDKYQIVAHPQRSNLPRFG